MPSYEQSVQADIRGILLRALDEDPGYRLVERSLRRVLDRHGRMVSTEELRAEILWLERQSLVRVEREPMERGGEVWFVQLLEDGQLVARGRAHPGIGRDMAPRA